MKIATGEEIAGTGDRIDSLRSDEGIGKVKDKSANRADDSDVGGFSAISFF